MRRPPPPRPGPVRAGRAGAACWPAAWTSGSSAGGIHRRCSGRCPGPGSTTARGVWPGSTPRASTRHGGAGQDGPGQLAACCASGDLAGAVEAAEHLVGLGPGLVPSGDSVVSGVLLALRLLGGAISGGTRAVWLANWLSAAVTCDATRRTTTLAASLLHCAAKGQAGAE